MYKVSAGKCLHTTVSNDKRPIHLYSKMSLLSTVTKAVRILHTCTLNVITIQKFLKKKKFLHKKKSLKKSLNEKRFINRVYLDLT